ncbi:MAG: tRNA (adenosine(37)-N6)-threonylcarbamoyltransferase complex dimerization subunit type 1 TsaB [Cetobacterium sp.]|nr:tRNA (adenosine(37)-N6)-threonylcarbamoyltransferase complex dimerization subunit type 1 TsaB [Cetobacterium sp.]
MLVLAIDTCTKIGSVALVDSSEGLIGEININAKQNHSDLIMEAVDSLFKLTKKTVKDVDKIAVSIGPGSFTGIRIGVGIGKGLAYSLNKPIAGINELDLIGHNTGVRGEKILAMIDARKERVFYGLYEFVNGELTLLGEYGAEELREILPKIDGKVLCLGDGALIYKNLIEEILGERALFNVGVNSLPRAGVLGELAFNKENNLFTLEPYYVNKSQAEREKESRN